MSAIKKVWVTKQGKGMVSISFESTYALPEYMRLKIKELSFPDKPTKKFPKRHTICLKLLDMDDLELIIETLSAYVDTGGEGDES
jgi:hypothetical protein